MRTDHRPHSIQRLWPALIAFCISWLLVVCSSAASGSQTKTPENAMQQIANALNADQLRELSQRQFAFDRSAWRDAKRCVTMLKDNMPILATPDFTTPKLDIVALTRAGEVLEFLEARQILQIPNPLGWQGVSNGIWYRVKLLNGETGWVFAGESTGNARFARLESLPVETAPSRPVAPANRQGPSTYGVIVVVLVVIVLVIVIASRRSSPTYAGTSASYGSGSSGGGSGSSGASGGGAAQVPQADWPWRDKSVVVGSRNVYTEGILCNTKVGHVEDHLLSDDSIHEDGLIFSKKVGSVERNFWGTPTAIVDNDGNKVGDIKDTIFGGKIIVDENGNKIGDYKGE